MDSYKVYEGQEPYLFVSYAHKDSVRVIPILNALEASGYRVWYDAGVEGGTEWPSYVARHLKKSAAVLVFLSGNAVESFNCRQELTMSINRKKNPVIVLLEDILWEKHDEDDRYSGVEMQIGTLHQLYCSRYASDDELVKALGMCRTLRCAWADEEDGPGQENASGKQKTARFGEASAVLTAQKQSVDQIRAEATAGDAEAQYTLGRCYETGTSVKQSWEEAVKWYTKAAKQNHRNALFALGCCLQNGSGTAKNQTRGTRLCLEAANQGLMFAQYRMGWCCEKGIGMEADPMEAYEWYLKAAEQGYASAQNALGQYYGNVDKWEEAVRWYRKAAKQGDAAAQLALGMSYACGQGVRCNPAEAAKWFQAAGEQGDAQAQFELARMYERGKGVPQDQVQAARWYWKAAKQDHGEAQCGLAVCYEFGRGVPQNMAEAQRWYTKASRKHIGFASRRLQQLNKQERK